MKYLTYSGGDGRSCFGWTDGVDVFALDGQGGSADLISFLTQPPDAIAAQVAGSRAAGAQQKLSATVFRPVIERPGKIICIGLNYAEHAREAGFPMPEYPALFLRVASTLVGAGAAIVRPLSSEMLDYEAELAVVIGKAGRHISADDALEHVAGYTAFNDASLRDFQRRTAQWTPGKNFDATGALGPILVTPDELPSGGANLHIECRLNGTVMQSSTTGDMIFDVPHAIAILSEFMTLEPGDLIMTGTPPGVGHARRPPVWMRDGDICEIGIEGIGILRNPVRDEVRMATRAAE